MKTTFLFSALAVGLSSFTIAPKEASDLKLHTADELGQRIVAALQQTSSVAYTELMPTITELHKAMNDYAAFYGSTLHDAQNDLRTTYYQKVIPETVHAFEHLINEGIEKGIDWTAIQYSQVEPSKAFDKKIDSGELILVFTFNSEVYRVSLKDALVIGGQWRASKHVQFQ